MGKVIAILTLLALAGCASTPSGNFCDLNEPRRHSAAVIDAMSDAEIDALVAHNRLGAELCGWKE